jgi:hypothetical protein
MPTSSIETREVLYAAYVGGRHHRGVSLRHAVMVRNGAVIEALCRRVRLDSLSDRNAGDPMAAPTCAYCLRRMRTLGLSVGERAS